MSIRSIQELVPPPADPVAAGTLSAFERIEEELGLALPSDYKALVASYGDGQWQEFWYLLNPFSPNRNLNLFQQTSRSSTTGEDLLSAERFTRARHPYPHPIWPEPGGIFPWAVTDNGGRFFWLTEGSVERWPSIYYPSRDPDYRELQLATSEIVAGLLSGELPLFEEEFAGEEPPLAFAPLAETSG